MNDLPSSPSSRAIVVSFLIVAVCIVGGIVLLLATRPQPVEIIIHPPAPTGTTQPTATPAPLAVYVTGAVAEPETLYSLPPGSRVSDAVNAAGGALPDADLERVNLAGFLHDGDQIHVPFAEEQAALPTPGGSGILNVNTATADELDTLPGIGPALAQAIVDYRDANGPFTSLDDLDAVSGVGPALLADLAALIVFE